MIELHPIVKRAEIACPHCGAGILAIDKDGVEVIGDNDWVEDSDVIGGLDQLTPAQLAGIDFYCCLETGSQPCCGTPYIIVKATFVNGQADEAFRDTYFYLNGDRGDETNYLASRDGQIWLVCEYNSQLGPVLEHHLGPFAWADTSWIGPAGVAACSDASNDSPWAFARTLLLELWDDLRVLTKERARSG